MMADTLLDGREVNDLSSIVFILLVWWGRRFRRRSRGTLGSWMGSQGVWFVVRVLSRTIRLIADMNDGICSDEFYSWLAVGRDVRLT
jgi:hypothetical protein